MSGVLQTEASAIKPRWSLACDSALAGSVAVFALWTVLYEGALVFRLPLVPLAILWLIVAPGLLAVTAVYNIRRAADEDKHEGLGSLAIHHDERGRRPTLLLKSSAIAAGAAGATLMALNVGNWFEIGWALGVVAIGLVGAALVRSREVSHRLASGSGSADVLDEQGRATSAPAHNTQPSSDSKEKRPHLGAAIVTLVLGAGSLFLLKGDWDDVYYVNLSTWIAEHGRIPLRDTMFGNQVVPSSYGGGIPVSSIEGLIGALARLLDIRAGSMAYFVVTPICALAAIWVLWQLAQLLAPHRAFMTFVYSLVFVGVSAGAYGSYSELRIWQGKVIAIAVLVPLIWVFAIRLARTRGRHWSVMVLLAGIAFFGLTSSAAILVPVLSCSLLLAGALLRRRKLLWGALLLAVGPAVSGLVLVLTGTSIGGKAPAAPSAPEALRVAFGSRPALTCLAVLALMLTPLLVRDRDSACLMWCSALGLSAALAPGVFEIVNHATGAGPVAWRMLLGTPLPTLVGLFAATALSWCLGRTKRWRIPLWLRTYALTPIVGLTLVCLLGIAGKPLWTANVRLIDRPVWKVDPEALANVKAVLATRPPRNGPLLLPAAEMRTLAIYTTRWFGVVPRDTYVAGLPESAERSAARYILLQLVSAQPEPAKADVEWALRELRVTDVCVKHWDNSARRLVRSIGYTPFVPIGSLMCAEKHRG